MPSTLRVLLLTGAAVLAVGAGAAGIAVAADTDEVPRGVRVLRTDLGGMTRAQAADAVEQALRPLSERPVPVRADDVDTELAPPASGLGFDVDAVVDDALSGGPVDRLRGWLGAARQLELVPAVDRDALDEALREVAADVDREPREGAVLFDGTEPRGVAPLTGRTLDVDASADLVAADWVDVQEPVELVVDVEDVQTTPEEVERALTEVARPAVSAPVLVEVAAPGEDASARTGRVLEVRPDDVAAALDLVREGGTLSPVLSGEALLEALSDRLREVEQAPVDARVVIRSGSPVVVPSETGLAVGADALAAAVLPALTAPAPRTASLELEVAQPSLTTEQAEGLGVREVVATYTTSFPCCRPRVQNIRRIAELVDGELVLPGETYSLNDDVGRRTLAKGFVPAPQILDGEFVDDVGGGVSQFATTMFNAVFFAGLEDVEHKPHSYYITRYPEGREATVFFPSVDLRWKNDSPHGVLVTTASTGTSVTVTLWGTKRFDVRAEKGPRTRVRPFEKRYVQRDDCTPAEGHEGFDIVVTRVFEQDGREVRREDFRTRYLPEPNFICGPPPA